MWNLSDGESDIPLLSRITVIENRVSEEVKLQEVLWPTDLIRSETVIEPGGSSKLKATKFCYNDSNPERNAIVWVRAAADSSNCRLLMPSDFVKYSKIVIETDANSKLKLKGVESSWTNLSRLKGIGWLAGLGLLPFSNQVQDLQDFPPPSYGQAIETPIKTETKIETKTPSQNNPNSSTSFFTKPITETILLTRLKEAPDDKKLYQVTQQAFPQGCNWCPDDITKNQKFYELILTDSHSVEIVHHRDPNDSSKISYSKCIIKKVLFYSQEWSSFYTEKPFSVRFIPSGFTYQDYKMAWFRAFFLRPSDHSWFFTFHPNCLKDFPIWFYQWWYSFGPTPDILPKEIKQSLDFYSENTTGDLFAKETHFHVEFQVPWIFCWNFQISQVLPHPWPLSLVREFKVKWWSGFSSEICSIDNVNHFLKTGEKLQQKVQARIQSEDHVPKTNLKESSYISIKTNFQK